MSARTGFASVVSVVAAILVSFANAQNTDGDAARGQALFEGKGVCLDCHRVGVRGSRFGPDLTDIGMRAGVIPLGGPGAAPGPAAGGNASDSDVPARARQELERSLTDPAAEILPANRTITLVTREGETITARVLNQDTFSLQLIDTKERLFTIQRTDVREFAWIKSSSMPSYRDKLTPQERDDLVAYLLTLKGINK